MQKAPGTAGQGGEPGTLHPARTARKTRNAAAAEGEQDASETAATVCNLLQYIIAPQLMQCTPVHAPIPARARGTCSRDSSLYALHTSMTGKPAPRLAPLPLLRSISQLWPSFSHIAQSCNVQAAEGGRRRKRGFLESLQESAVKATLMQGDKSHAVDTHSSCDCHACNASVCRCMS